MHDASASHYGLEFLALLKKAGHYGCLFEYEEYQALKAAATREEFEAFLARTPFARLPVHEDPKDTWQEFVLFLDVDKTGVEMNPRRLFLELVLPFMVFMLASVTVFPRLEERGLMDSALVQWGIPAAFFLLWAVYHWGWQLPRYRARVAEFRRSLRMRAMPDLAPPA